MAVFWVVALWYKFTVSIIRAMSEIHIVLFFSYFLVSLVAILMLTWRMTGKNAAGKAYMRFLFGSDIRFSFK
jgi:hypothetical protein